MKTSYEYVTEILNSLNESDMAHAERTHKWYRQELYHIAQLMDPYMTPSKGEYPSQRDFDERMNDIRKNYWKFNLNKNDEVVRNFLASYNKSYSPEVFWWAYLISAQSLYKSKNN